MTIVSALQTPDGAWRVEVVKRGSTHWCRVVRGDSEIDWLGIAGVERILGEAGVDMAELIEVTGDPPLRQTTVPPKTLLRVAHGCQCPDDSDE